MPLPSLQILLDRFVSQPEITVRLTGHDAFDAAEMLDRLDQIRFTFPDSLTLEEAAQLLGTDPDDLFGSTMLGEALRSFV
jgi:hypothetical protein